MDRQTSRWDAVLKAAFYRQLTYEYVSKTSRFSALRKAKLSGHLDGIITYRYAIRHNDSALEVFLK